MWKQELKCYKSFNGAKTVEDGRHLILSFDEAEILGERAEVESMLRFAKEKFRGVIEGVL